MTTSSSKLIVGVFDSGVGGLTVMRALRRAAPGHDYIYLGDTARLPYGTKSARTVRSYARLSTQALVDRGIDVLIVACNTASSFALDLLAQTYSDIPVFGVIAPGAEAAVNSSVRGCIAIIGTESTVRGGTYQQEIFRLNPSIQVVARSCPLLVTLAEDGWVSGTVPETVLSAYLDPWLFGDKKPDVLLLGCTHFPILADAIEDIVGPSVRIVDSAITTAMSVVAMIGHGHGSGKLTLMATDDVERFARVGEFFLNQKIDSSEVVRIDL